MSLLDKVDAVVMLTWSDWFTELRSNRYHYATRFSKLKPVIFVQPDLETQTYVFKKTDVENITVLRIYNQYGSLQNELLNTALLELNCIAPLFWVYNIYFDNFLSHRQSSLNVYHATEDYVSEESAIVFTKNELLTTYQKTLNLCQLIIAVSEGVNKGLRSSFELDATVVTINNGCDYAFFCPKNYQNQIPRIDSKIAFYQGNIFHKLDYALLDKLAKLLPDWTFNFCGKVLFNEPEWFDLLKNPNVHYLGLLTPEEIRDQAYLSTVGLIPFVKNKSLISASFPLKTFEYLACGLPTISIPIDSLMEFSNVIQFANTPEQFAEEIKKAAELRWSIPHLERRLKVSAEQDYDLRFQQAIQCIENKK